MEEAYPEAAAILAQAGWTPHPEWSVYTRGTLVMGGFAGSFHVKDYARIQPGHPLYSADTPDTAEEAAAWLVTRFALATEATLEPLALQSETGESLEHESDGETAQEPAPTEANSDIPLAEVPLDVLTQQEGELASGVFEADPIDADFTIEDLGTIEGEDADLPALEELSLDIEQEARNSEAMRAAAEQSQDRFIGLDDLDRVRSLRIGDVATEALRLTTQIEQAVSEQAGEFSNIQAYVVSHLDKHTGAFTPQDDASRATYGRFLELSSARSKVALIDSRRKDATAFLLSASRDDVVGFDVAAAFA